MHYAFVGVACIALALAIGGVACAALPMSGGKVFASILSGVLCLGGGIVCFIQAEEESDNRNW
jgi:hypothetical protein